MKTTTIAVVLLVILTGGLRAEKTISEIQYPGAQLPGLAQGIEDYLIPPPALCQCVQDFGHNVVFLASVDADHQGIGICVVDDAPVGKPYFNAQLISFKLEGGYSPNYADGYRIAVNKSTPFIIPHKVLNFIYDKLNRKLIRATYGNMDNPGTLGKRLLFISTHSVAADYMTAYRAIDDSKRSQDEVVSMVDWLLKNLRTNEPIDENLILKKLTDIVEEVKTEKSVSTEQNKGDR